MNSSSSRLSALVGSSLFVLWAGAALAQTAEPRPPERRQYTFGELDYPPALPQTTSLSAQEVQAQLQQAKVSGQYTFGELEYPPVAAATGSAKSRADVQAELAQAKASGQYTFGELEYPPISR